MTYPPTDEICREIADSMIGFPNGFPDAHDYMRAGADWQLEQVIKWIEENGHEYGYYVDWGARDQMIAHLKEAMRPHPSGGQLMKINGYEIKPGADLKGADLSEAVLKYANLSNADLSNADLRNADLEGADLRGVNLRCADLSNADLRNADLEGADLRGAELMGADLENADFRFTYLDGDTLKYADRRGVSHNQLENDELWPADLSGVDLREAFRGCRPPLYGP